MCVEKYDVIVIGGGPGGYQRLLNRLRRTKNVAFEGKV